MSTTVVADRPPRMGRDFLKLWGGQAVSLFGSQITEVALPLTAVLLLHADAAQMGLLGVARWVPFLLFTLWVGALADRVRRLPMLIGSDIGRAALMGTIVALALTDMLTMPVLIASVFVFGAFTVVFEVSYYSYVPSLVPRERLVTANSRLAATTSVAQVGGPSLGGALVQLLSAPIALLVDAISFVVSAAALARIRGSEPKPEPAADEGNALARIREGLAVTYHNPYLRALIGIAALYNLFDQWIFVLFVLYAVRELGLTAGAVGVVLAAGAVGALLGALSAGSATRRLGVGPAVLWSVALECVVLLAVPVVPAHHVMTLPALMIVFALNGMGTALSSVAAISVRQVVTPHRLLGRMNASYRFVSYGSIAIGAAVGGLAGHLLGLRVGLAVGAVGLLTAVVCALCSPLRSLHDLATLDAVGDGRDKGVGRE